MQWGVNPGCMISGDQFVCVFCILKSEYWHKKVTFFICFPPWTHNLPNWSSSASAPKMPWMMLCILGKCCSLVHLLKRQRWCPIFYSLFFSCLWGHWEPTNGFYLIVLSENFCPPQISWLTNPSTAFWIFLDIFWKLIYLQVHSWNTIWFHQACQDKWQILSPHCCIAYSIGSPKKLRFGQYWYILLLIDPSSFSNILPISRKQTKYLFSLIAWAKHGPEVGEAQWILEQDCAIYTEIHELVFWARWEKKESDSQSIEVLQTLAAFNGGDRRCFWSEAEHCSEVKDMLPSFIRNILSI